MNIELTQYLGDGVHAEYNPCDASFTLRTGSHVAEECGNTIVLKSGVFRALWLYGQQISQIESEAEKRERCQGDPRIQPHVARNEAIDNRMDFRGPGEY
jgi:hypothetical protein